MIRSILSVIVGILAGVVTILVLEMAGHFFYPPPAGLDPQNVEAFKEFVAAAPMGMLLSVLIAWAGGAFVGGPMAAVCFALWRPGLAGKLAGIYQHAVRGLERCFELDQGAHAPGHLLPRGL